MTRDTLTDRQWEHFRPVLPPQKPVTGRRAIDRRLILNGGSQQRPSHEAQRLLGRVGAMHLLMLRRRSDAPDGGHL